MNRFRDFLREAEFNFFGLIIAVVVIVGLITGWVLT